MSARMHRPRQQQHERSTVGGRNLKYVLRVIQEPERARACGSGAKSSADRRPVDPPPVVELRIFELKDGQEEDITFSYSANFFLFATLEVARPIANGRVHQPPPPQQVPVLTGMPVSGMAYLDRPSEAGYFIFPDLSVRHEGSYKLAFHLYEETKSAEDATVESPEKKKAPVGPGTPDSSFDYVTEVKSREFTVFSAKKFPGLSESTALSRTVAEQGCRVRIRRDVRMRRRTEKPGEGFDEAHDEFNRRGRPTEQDPYQRERSLSSSSGSDCGSPTRGPEFPQPQYGPYSHPQHPPGPHGHLGFPSESQYPPRSFQTPQAPVHQPYPQPPPHTPQYAQPPPPPPPPPQQYRPGPPPPQPNYGYDRQYPQSAYPANPPGEAFEQEPRRASMAYPTSHQPRDYPPVESFNRQGYHQPYSRMRSPPPALAPIKPAPHSSPLAPVHSIAPLPSSPYDHPPERRPAFSQYPPPPAEAALRSTKRPFDAVFKSTSDTEPLFNGKRPGSSHASDDAIDEDDIAQLKMSYKRADGGSCIRSLPKLE